MNSSSLSEPLEEALLPRRVVLLEEVLDLLFLGLDDSFSSSLSEETASKALLGRLNRTRLFEAGTSFAAVVFLVFGAVSGTFFSRILVPSGTMMRSSSCSTALGLRKEERGREKVKLQGSKKNNYERKYAIRADKSF